MSGPTTTNGHNYIRRAAKVRGRSSFSAGTALWHRLYYCSMVTAVIAESSQCQQYLFLPATNNTELTTPAATGTSADTPTPPSQQPCQKNIPSPPRNDVSTFLLQNSVPQPACLHARTCTNTLSLQHGIGGVCSTGLVA